MVANVQGRVGRMITKKYRDGYVWSRTPNMSRVKPSAAQTGERRSMQSSALFLRALQADPAGQLWLEARARERGWPESAVARQEYARLRRAARESGVEWTDEFAPPIYALVAATLESAAAERAALPPPPESGGCCL